MSQSVLGQEVVEAPQEKASAVVEEGAEEGIER
jgi:hypothetical protein